MNRKSVVAVIIILVLVLLFIIVTRRAHEVSMLLVNGTVYTVNEKQPTAQAVAVDDGRIVGVGSNEDIRAKFKSTRVIDLHGRFVYPGLIDAHGHVEGLGAFLMNVDLDGTTSVKQIQEIVAGRLSSIKPGAWLRGRGWEFQSRP